MGRAVSADCSTEPSPNPGSTCGIVSGARPDCGSGNPSEPFHLRGVPDETIGIDVDTETVVERVRSAVRSHRTQWSYQTMDNDRALSESLRREHWVLAWPPPPPGRAPLRDIFQDL
jgi:hypothetical protein